MPPTAVGSIQTSLRKGLPSPIDLLRCILPGGGANGGPCRLHHAAWAGEVRLPQSSSTADSRTDSSSTARPGSALERRGKPAPRRRSSHSPTASTGDQPPFRPISAALLVLLRGYKLLISPLLPSACRFHPTCSCYMYGAIESHGVGRGIYLGIRRLLKCHPWHPGGIDLVPPQSEPLRTELHGR